MHSAASMKVYFWSHCKHICKHHAGRACTKIEKDALFPLPCFIARHSNGVAHHAQTQTLSYTSNKTTECIWYSRLCVLFVCFFVAWQTFLLSTGRVCLGGSSALNCNVDSLTPKRCTSITSNDKALALTESCTKNKTHWTLAVLSWGTF